MSRHNPQPGKICFEYLEANVYESDSRNEVEEEEEVPLKKKASLFKV